MTAPPTHVVDVSRDCARGQAGRPHVRQLRQVEAVVELQQGEVVALAEGDVKAVLEFPA